MEIERARLTRILASIREEQGNISEAANVLQELQVPLSVTTVTLLYAAQCDYKTVRR